MRRLFTLLACMFGAAAIVWHDADAGTVRALVGVAVLYALCALAGYFYEKYGGK